MSVETIGPKLYEYFRSIGLSQSDIAAKFKVSKASINALFTGKRSFGKSQAEKWESEFGISKAWLLTGEGDMMLPTINQNNVSGSNVVGENTTTNNYISKELLEIIKSRDEELKKRDEQVDRLLSLIEKLTIK